jgi:hypothetical protein
MSLDRFFSQRMKIKGQPVSLAFDSQANLYLALPH